MPIETYAFYRGLSSLTDFSSIIAKDCHLTGNIKVDGTINGADSVGVNIGNLNILENIIRNRSDNKYLELKGGTSDTNSARLMLFSTERQDTNIGNFYLCARSSTESIKLEGKPNKSLTWNNNDLSGVAIVSKNLAANGYIKFACGLILQWGYVPQSGTARTSEEVTYPINITSSARVIAQITSSSDTPIDLAVSGIDTTKFKVSFTESTVLGFNWFAIGH